MRCEPHELSSIEVSDVMLDRSAPEQKHGPTFVEPDTVLSHQAGRIGSYHHNPKSVGPVTATRIQNLSNFERLDPWAVFFVQDNGMGIHKGQWNDVFELFTRSQASPEDARLGAGLGLARRIVEHHGGRIWLDSHVGKGSTYYSAIPGVKRA